LRESSILPRTASEQIKVGRSGKDWLVLGIILFVYLLVSILLFDPRLHTGGDNARYICLARSVLAGKGYSDIFRPGEPPHAQYPFGYPLLLTAVMALFSNSVIALKLLSLLLGAGCVLLLFLLLRDLCSRVLLFSVVLLFAVAPLLLEYSHWILSDVSFTFFSLLSLFLFKQADLNKKKFPPLFWASIICMLFAYYIRTVGAALLLGVLFYFGFRKRLKRLFVSLAIIVVAVLPWSIRTARISQGGGYLTQLTLRNPYDIGSGRIGMKDGLVRLKSNSVSYFLVNIPKTLFSVHQKFWPVARRGLGIYVFGFLVSGVMLLGFARELGRGNRLSHYYVTFYMGTILIWPQVWATDRFFLPVAPFALFYFFSGLLLLTRKLEPLLRKRVSLFVAGLILLSSLGTIAGTVPHAMRIMRAYASGDRFAGYPAEWTRYYETATYASKFTPRDGVFMARKPALFYLFANRKCLVYPFTFDKQRIVETIKENRVSYVIVDGFTWTQTTRRYLVPVIVANERDFEIIYTTQPPTTYMLRYIGG